MADWKMTLQGGVALTEADFVFQGGTPDRGCLGFLQVRR